MDYKYIEQLLQRYWDCQTTLEEEAILKAFFSQEDIPAELAKYKPLFAYEAEEVKTDVLGDDFDARMEALVAEPLKVKAKVVPLQKRLLPLFKAAAMVAIILTLGNASQRAFDTEEDPAALQEAFAPKIQSGPSVATVDTVKTDSLKKVVPMPTIIK